VSLLGSWAGDVQTQRLTVSDQLFRNLGLPVAERPPSEATYLACLHPDDRDLVAADMQRIRQGGAAADIVFRTDPARGPQRWLRRTARRIGREAQGLPPRYIGTLQDITDAVLAEEQLRQINQELEQRVAERTAQLSQANQELEAFSYSVSHDLKAPLRGIDGYSQLLVEDYGPLLDEQGRDFVGRIRHGVQLMSALISDLLEYSRMERRGMNRDAVALQPLVQQVLAVYEADIRRTGAQVQMELQPFTLSLDREGMAVVLRNLIGNALKFSRNSQPPRVEIGSRQQDGRRILWVRDNGVGFDMKYHDRMFGIFQRLHRAEEFPGTGVGLALVAKAVQRMGGRVWAESAPGAGATFYLEFPE
jgi:light-regulated signal transduction histidine kinase (bacteriophytochrome)